MTPINKHDNTEKNSKWELIPWPTAPGMKNALCKLLITLVVLGTMILGLYGWSLQSGKNDMPAINLVVCVIYLLTVTVTAHTEKGKKRINEGIILVAIAAIAFLIIGLINPSKLLAENSWKWATANVATIVLAMLLVIVAIIRYCYRPGAKIGAHGVGITTFTGIWTITLCLCMQMATTSEAQYAGAPITNQGIYQVTTTGNTASTTNSPASPKFQECPLFLIALLVGLFILACLWAVCRAAHLCGNTNATPPPSSGTTSSAASSAPAISFHSYTTTNNATGTSTTGVTSDQLLFMVLTNLVTTNSIGLWNNVSGFHDPYIDSGYPVTQTLNYSVQGTTDVSQKSGWHTLYTVVQFTTSDPYTPYICMCIYTNSVTTGTNGITVTNGVPIGTNRWQLTLASGKVAGVMTFGSVCPLPVDMTGQHMEFRTWFNTNVVSTVGP